MDIKHQIFVSSTFKDLVEERKEVIHALLELDCIPAGMELFPAADEDAWSLITEVIDGCDYYILILAGKYGSVGPNGVGYTEMEFDYAVEQGKPILCFLYEDIEQLTSSKIESSDAGKERLNSFRDKAKEKHCKFWNSAADLGGKVSRSLVKLKKKHPSEGWVPGRYAADQKMLAELEKLRARVAELEYKALSRTDSPPPNFSELAGGDDEVSIRWHLITEKGSGTTEEVEVKVTWDKLFSYCGTALTGECTSSELEEKIKLCFWHALPEDYAELNQHSFSRVPIYYILEDQIHIQFQALGLMEPGTRKRAVADNSTYWKLTPFGEKYLIQIRAWRKGSKESLNN